MSVFLICGGFAIIAAMRVVQRVCSKTSSLLVADNYTFFKYGAAYQLFAALFALVTAIVTGFGCVNLPTLVCSAISAIMFGIDLFCGIEAIKGCSLVVANTFANGGLIVSVAASYIWFGEGVSVFQIAGLVVFFVSVYLLSVTKKEEKANKISPKTLILLIIDLLVNGAIMIVQKYFALKVEGGNTAIFSLFTFAFCAAIMAACALAERLKLRPAAKLPPAKTEDADNSAKKPFLCGKLVICAAALALALFAINYLITEMGQYVDSVILFPVSSAISAVITALVGALVYKEKPNAFGVAGIILGLVSIILLSVFTPALVSAIFGR